MEFIAKLAQIRITPRKVGFVLDQVRGKNVNAALTDLSFNPRKKTSEIISKLIKSAVANADHKGTVDLDRLFIKTLMVGQGPTLKRFAARAKGAGDRLNKKSSNIVVILAEK